MSLTLDTKVNLIFGAFLMDLCRNVSIAYHISNILFRKWAKTEIIPRCLDFALVSEDIVLRFF